MLLKRKLFLMLTLLGSASLAAADSIHEDELRQKPELLQQLLGLSIQQQHYELMQALLPLYRESPLQDAFLLAYAEALALREQGDWAAAIERLQALNSQEALPQLQFQLAQWQFQNYSDDAARESLALLRQQNPGEDWLQAADALESALQRRQEWRFDGSGHYLYDPNINNAPSQAKHGNWTFEEPKTAHGLHFEVSAARDMDLKNGWFLPLRASANLDWYWNAHEADDVRLRLESGLGWRNARHEYQITGYGEQRSLGNRGYSSQLGAQFSWKFRPTADWHIRLYQQSGHERHDRRKHLDGWRIGSGLSAVHQATAQRYYFANLSHFYHGAEQSDDRYHYLSASLGLGQSWDNGLSLELSHQLAWRRHQGKDLFQIQRRDFIQRLRLRGSHEALSWEGFQPQLVLNLSRTDSNHFYYDRPWQARAHMEIEKRF